MGPSLDWSRFTEWPYYIFRLGKVPLKTGSWVWQRGVLGSGNTREGQPTESRHYALLKMSALGAPGCLCRLSL